MRSPMSSSAARSVASGSRWLRLRIEENIAQHGLIYPWWVPVLSMLGQVGAVLGALRIRDALWPPEWIALTLLMVTLPGFLMVVVGRHLPHTLETLSALAAATWLFTDQSLNTGFDLTPVLLAVLTAEVVARDGVRNGLVAAAVSVAMIMTVASGPGLSGAPLHVVVVLFGFMVGYTLLWQMRALAAERAARETERARATLAERERIAREIHDLVAHSLSITLLQITGARHSLRDVGSDDADGSTVAEVDAALADAERVGRQAMSDIRQTVSSLADGPAQTQALPGAVDIAALVKQMERAGLAVDYAESGDASRLAQATGLGLYRIAQESLANIAKHAPTSTARVQFTVTTRQARLVIRNTLPAGNAVAGRGSGLAGMSARAEQLGASLSAAAHEGDWVVELRVPLRERNGFLSCPLRPSRTTPKVVW